MMDDAFRMAGLGGKEKVVLIADNTSVTMSWHWRRHVVRRPSAV